MFMELSNLIRAQHILRWIQILLLLMIISCSANLPLEGFDKQGHRGCRGLMPENTIPAMIKAIDLGVTTLEMDIAFSADRQAVLSHEPFFSHDITTKPDGSFINEEEERSFNLYKMNYAEIKKYNVGLKPHPRFHRQLKIKAYKPLLTELIDSVEQYTQQKKLPSVYYNIETKTTPATDNIYHPAPPEFIDRLLQIIDQKMIRERVVIQSFDIRTLQYLHQKYPEVNTSLLIEPVEMITVHNKINKLGFRPDVVSPEYNMVTSSLINDLHKEKIKIIPWTVNDSGAINNLKALGVDGIISDYPDLLR